MECTKCRKRLNLENFSYKNVKEKIYYMHCNNCRQKFSESHKNHKEKMKEDYNIVKQANKIECDCGINYIAFREYHIKRHENSKKHTDYLLALVS